MNKKWTVIEFVVLARQGLVGVLKSVTICVSLLVLFVNAGVVFSFYVNVDVIVYKILL